MDTTGLGTAAFPAACTCVPDSHTPAPVEPGKQGYVAGFLFDEDDQVLLIRKRRPRWQAGRLNGVGGKIEPGETPAAAMAREFVEETGLVVPDWDLVTCLTFPPGAVWFFRRFTSTAVLGQAVAMTDEPLEVHSVTTLLRPDADTIPNLRWLLPLSAHRTDRYVPSLVAERP